MATEDLTNGGGPSFSAAPASAPRPRPRNNPLPHDEDAAMVDYEADEEDLHEGGAGGAADEGSGVTEEGGGDAEGGDGAKGGAAAAAEAGSTVPDSLSAREAAAMSTPGEAMPAAAPAFPKNSSARKQPAGHGSQQPPQQQPQTLLCDRRASATSLSATDENVCQAILRGLDLVKKHLAQKSDKGSGGVGGKGGKTTAARSGVSGCDSAASLAGSCADATTEGAIAAASPPSSPGTVSTAPAAAVAVAAALVRKRGSFYVADRQQEWRQRRVRNGDGAGGGDGGGACDAGGSGGSAVPPPLRDADVLRPGERSAGGYDASEEGTEVTEGEDDAAAAAAVAAESPASRKVSARKKPQKIAIGKSGEKSSSSSGAGAGAGGGEGVKTKSAQVCAPLPEGKSNNDDDDVDDGYEAGDNLAPGEDDAAADSTPLGPGVSPHRGGGPRPRDASSDNAEQRREKRRDRRRGGRDRGEEDGTGLPGEGMGGEQPAGPHLHSLMSPPPPPPPVCPPPSVGGYDASEEGGTEATEEEESEAFVPREEMDDDGSKKKKKNEDNVKEWDGGERVGRTNGRSMGPDGMEVEEGRNGGRKRRRSRSQSRSRSRSRSTPGSQPPRASAERRSSPLAQGQQASRLPPPAQQRTLPPQRISSVTAAAVLPERDVGMYVPPAKRRQLEQEQKQRKQNCGPDDDGDAAPMADGGGGGRAPDVTYQRRKWEDLRKIVNGTINRLNASTIRPLIHDLFRDANLLRGRGLLARTVLRAATTSPKYSGVYAALVAVINTKLPEIGELVLSRAILQFRSAYRRRDRSLAMAVSAFIGHLFNQAVCHELLCLQILTVLLDGDPTDDSVEVAMGFVRVVGRSLSEVSPAGVRAVMERFRGLLHDGSIGRRVQYRVEELMSDRRNNFEKFGPPVKEELDLVERDDQITFETGLDDEGLKKQEILDVFRFDEHWNENEATWGRIRAEILGEDGDSSGGESETDSSEEGSSGASGSNEESSEDENDDEAVPDQELALTTDKDMRASQKHHFRETVVKDLSESDLVHLRRTIYLTIMSSATFEECAHKLAKTEIPDGRESELVNMIIECCSQERTFLRYYGLISSRFCFLEERWREAFGRAFGEQYATIHRLETNKLRNVAKLFAHLLHTDSMPWSCLHVVKLNEDETTSSSRIFIKILVQEMAEAMGMRQLQRRFESDDREQMQWYAGMFPKDNPRNARYAINFFTTIGLGPLTDGMREWLKEAPKMILAQAKEAAESEAAEKAAKAAAEGNESDSSSSSSSNTGSSSSSSTSTYSSSSTGSRSNSSYSCTSSSFSSRSRRLRDRRGRGVRGRQRPRMRRSRSRSVSLSSSTESSRSLSSSPLSHGRSDRQQRRNDHGRDRLRSGCGSLSSSSSRSRSHSRVRGCGKAGGSDRRFHSSDGGTDEERRQRKLERQPDHVDRREDGRSHGTKQSRSRSNPDQSRSHGGGFPGRRSKRERSNSDSSSTEHLGHRIGGRGRDASSSPREQVGGKMQQVASRSHGRPSDPPGISRSRRSHSLGNDCGHDQMDKGSLSLSPCSKGRASGKSGRRERRPSSSSRSSTSTSSGDRRRKHSFSRLQS